MKKTIIVTIVLALLLTSLPARGFSDSPASEKWVYENFMVLKEAGLLKGYPDNSFRGENSATRYDMVELTATVLKHLEGKLELSLQDKIFLDEAAVKKTIADSINNEDQLDAVYLAIRNLENEFKEELSTQDLKVTTLEEDIVELQLESQDLKKEVRNAK